MLAHNKVTFALNIKNVVVPLTDIPTYVRECAECKSVYGINVEAIILCNWKHVSSIYTGESGAVSSAITS